MILLTKILQLLTARLLNSRAYKVHIFHRKDSQNLQSGSAYDIVYTTRGKKKKPSDIRRIRRRKSFLCLKAPLLWKTWQRGFFLFYRNCSSAYYIQNYKERKKKYG